MSSYTYSSLTLPDSIRVLELHPLPSKSTPETATGTQSPVKDPGLSGDLIHIRISEEKPPDNEEERDECSAEWSKNGKIPGYETLSYVWGKDPSSKSIYITTPTGTASLAIGHNLYSALINLRRRDRTVRLWVDAICINQADLDERGQQVQMMQKIYSSSEQTIIFLGIENGGNTGRSAWNFLERKATWAMNSDQKVDFSLPAKREEGLHFRGGIEDVEIDVLRRPWFRRIWVFQEVVVSRQLVIQCGSRRISWDDFCGILLLNIRQHDPYGFSRSWDDGVENLRDMFHARCIYQEAHDPNYSRPIWYSQVPNFKGSGTDILHMLARSRGLQATDPRDKIYALLGISTGIDVQNKRAAIRYGERCSDVYIEFMRLLLETTKDYTPLSYLEWEAFDEGAGKFLPLGYFAKNGRRAPEFEYGQRYVNYQGYELGNQVTSQEYLPSWVPNFGVWDRTIWFNNVLNNLSRRTILGTLDPESDDDKAIRSRVVLKSRTFDEQSRNLAMVGSTIGSFVRSGPRIVLLGKDEVDFQRMRDLYSDDEVNFSKSIMDHWNVVMTDLCREHPYLRSHGFYSSAEYNSEAAMRQRLSAYSSVNDDNSSDVDTLHQRRTGSNLPSPQGNSSVNGKSKKRGSISKALSIFSRKGKGTSQQESEQSMRSPSPNIRIDRPPSTNVTVGETPLLANIDAQSEPYSPDTSGTSFFSALVDTSSHPPPNSVEHHLLARAHKTAAWSDDNNKAAAMVVDHSSIVDGKSVGEILTPDDRRILAIMPTRAAIGDLVAYFRGSRVPYVVRHEVGLGPVAKAETKQYAKAIGLDRAEKTVWMKCRIIGECVVNGFDEFEAAEMKRFEMRERAGGAPVAGGEGSGGGLGGIVPQQVVFVAC